MLTAEFSLHALHSQTAGDNVSCGVLLAQLLLSATAQTHRQRQTHWCHYSRKMTRVHSVGQFKKCVGAKMLTGQKAVGLEWLNFDPDAALRGRDLCINCASLQYFIHSFIHSHDAVRIVTSEGIIAVLIINLCEDCEILRSASLVDCCFLNDGDNHILEINEHVSLLHFL